MLTIPPLRVLFFDVFGTCVQQRTPVGEELRNAAMEALKSLSPLDDQVRSRAMDMRYEDWFEFGGEWNKEADTFVKESIAKNANVDWKAADTYRVEVLKKMLARRGLVILDESVGSSEFRVKDGSLWNESQLNHLGHVWHRLPPWPDTRRGLDLLNQRFSTVALSNTYKDLIEGLVRHSNIPFTHAYSSDMFDSYKPNPKVYLGAAAKMGVKPEECALVAAHLGDLKGAKACGFYAIYVERPLEEKAPELRGEDIPDMHIKEHEGGFVHLAKRLGIQDA